jgi:hypothetical protein
LRIASFSFADANPRNLAAVSRNAIGNIHRHRPRAEACVVTYGAARDGNLISE